MNNWVGPECCDVRNAHHDPSHQTQPVRNRPLRVIKGDVDQESLDVLSFEWKDVKLSPAQ